MWARAVCARVQGRKGPIDACRRSQRSIVQIDVVADRGVVLVGGGCGNRDIPRIVRDCDAVDRVDAIAFDLTHIDCRRGDGAGFVEHSVLVRIPMRSHTSEPLAKPKSATTKRPSPLRRATGNAQLQFSRSPEGPTVTSDVTPVSRLRTYSIDDVVRVGRIEIRSS
jgi:hypothetical protein